MRAQLPQRGSREGDFEVTVRPVDRQIAIDDHRIGLRRIGKLAGDAPVIPEETVCRRKVDVREDDDTGHAGSYAVQAG